jgi:Zn-dependent M28 family amino/carboxypeptidase
MGIDLTGGRFCRQPSTGAVDDGAAVAVLLALAHKLHRGELHPGRTSVTLLLTLGEEAQMQGALAYVRDRDSWPLPAYVVNLELLGQNGGYLLWDQDGTALLRLPADADLNRLLAQTVEHVTGKPPARQSLISSDTFAFLRAGIPAATLGSFDRDLYGRGYHSALDNPSRVHPERLAESIEILSCLLSDIDAALGSSQ